MNTPGLDPPAANRDTALVARKHALSEQSKRCLHDAVADVESRSSAEVVVTVRARAGFYGHVYLASGAVCAYLMLLVMLFAPPVFELHWIALLELAAFVGGASLMASMPGLSVRLVSKATYEQRLVQAARAVFYELGVSATRKRSGVLVYYASHERRVVVIADIGVLATIPQDMWQAAVDSLQGLVLPRLLDEPASERLATAIRAFGDMLAVHLPREPDDIDELVNVA